MEHDPAAVTVKPRMQEAQHLVVQAAIVPSLGEIQMLQPKAYQIPQAAQGLAFRALLRAARSELWDLRS